MHKYRRPFSIVAMIGICSGFVGTVFSSLIYMAKDYNAYNSVYAFFGVSTELRLALTRLTLSKIATLRLLNLSHIAFVLASVLFALLFSDLVPRRASRVVRLTALMLASIQLVFLDPQFIIRGYFKAAGPFADIFAFRAFYQALKVMLRWTAICELLFAVALLGVAFLKTPRSMRAGVGLVALLFSALAMVYLYMYSWLPIQVLWLSRVANYVGFESLPVNRNTPFNTFAPMISGLFVVCFSLITCITLFQSSRIRRLDQVFRSKVSAVDTVSRVFCHYLKNELLSQQAELKLLLLKADPALKEDLSFIIHRNDEIYMRLSAVRDTMKQRRMPLDRLNLMPLVQTAFLQMDLPGSMSLVSQHSEESVWVKGNADQLREVFVCLVRNALEADPTDAARRIYLNYAILRQYVDISISNDGPRIKREEWDAIFDPFFTTKATKSNWGLGLALAKNVVTLHQGRIWMDEETIEGVPMTTFHVILPLAD